MANLVVNLASVQVKWANLSWKLSKIYAQRVEVREFILTIAHEVNSGKSIERQKRLFSQAQWIKQTATN